MTTPDEAAIDAMREHLYELLRRVKPRVLVAVMVSGEKRKLDTGGGRQVRYSQLARQIVTWAADIDRIELANVKGEVIEVWHPRGQPVEDDDAEQQAAALAGVPLPSSAHGWTAEQIAQFAVSVGNMMVMSLQKAVDHAVDRHRLGQKDLIDGFAKLAGGLGDRLAYVEKQQTSSFKMVREALVLEGQAREQALDALRLAREQGDPNDPDAMMAQFARTAFERQFGLPPGSSSGAPASSPANSKRAPKDHDEPS